jgi:chromate transporter
MWFGFLQAGALGAAAVAAPLVLPACLLVTAVAALYAKYQGLSVVHEVFLGVGPAVLAIVAIAAYKLARTTNKSDPLLGIAGAEPPQPRSPRRPSETGEGKVRERRDSNPRPLP